MGLVANWGGNTLDPDEFDELARREAHGPGRRELVRLLWDPATGQCWLYRQTSGDGREIGDSLDPVEDPVALTRAAQWRLTAAQQHRIANLPPGGVRVKQG